MFNKKINPGNFEIIKEGEEEVMKVNYDNINLTPSIEESPECMADTLDKLIQVPSVNRIIFYKGRNYEYDYQQTQILREIANIYTHLSKQKNLMSLISMQANSPKIETLRYIILTLLKSDPIAAYVELRRLIREERINISKYRTREEREYGNSFVNIFEYAFNLLDKSKLIQITKPYLDGLRLGERGIYKTIFRANITPDFMHTRLMADIPIDAIELDAYKVDEDTEVSVYDITSDIKHLYQLNPIEFKISEDEYELLEAAKQVHL